MHIIIIIISLITALLPHCSRGLRTVCRHCWSRHVPSKSQGEASVSCVGGKQAADHYVCILKLSQTGEEKHARLSLLSPLPRESLRKQKRFIQQLEEKRNEFVIEHRGSHCVPVFTSLHPHSKSDTYLTLDCEVNSNVFQCNFPICHIAPPLE